MNRRNLEIVNTAKSEAMQRLDAGDDWQEVWDWFRLKTEKVFRADKKFKSIVNTMIHFIYTGSINDRTRMKSFIGNIGNKVAKSQREEYG
jgi:hypothetical protein